MTSDSGDLSFAPDFNSYDYIHCFKDNIKPSLSVINKMMVSKDFVETFVSKSLISNNFRLLFFLFVVFRRS